MKEKIIINRELNSSSAAIIWNLISTDVGMSRWLADDVRHDGETITFLWGEVWRHHEIRKANIVSKSIQKHIRLVWEDEEDEEAYVEIQMERSTITNDYVLTVTDFAYPDEVESLRAIWQENFTRLRQTSGV